MHRPIAAMRSSAPRNALFQHTVSLWRPHAIHSPASGFGRYPAGASNVQTRDVPLNLKPEPARPTFQCLSFRSTLSFRGRGRRNLPHLREATSCPLSAMDSGQALRLANLKRWVPPPGGWPTLPFLLARHSVADEVAERRPWRRGRVLRFRAGSVAR